MLKIAILLTLAGLQLSFARERPPSPDPSELLRYQTLKPKRLLYENLKETKLYTVPGYGAKESEDDNEPPFFPSLECGDEYLNMTSGTFGTIISPNYPRRYLPDLQCEWILEGAPGTVVEVTLFDSVTQPWLFAFYDYIKISLDGSWDRFYRFAGDVNYKTPYTLVSKENRLVVRFITSAWLNFRGFSLSYVVRDRLKADTNPQTNEFGSVLNNNLVAVCNRRPDTPPRRNDKVTQDRDNVKIINGDVAVAHQYPFTVALVIDGRYFCGGTLIDDVNVITAAHCVDGAERIVLIFGLHNMTNPAERYYSRQIRLVEFPDTANHVFVHPHYNPDTGANDIAIVRVADKVKFTGYVQPIYLPSVYSTSNAFYGKDLKTVGWGQYELEADGISAVLREGRSKVISNGDCREEFRGAITGNNICTLTPYIPPEEGNATTPATTTVEPSEPTENPRGSYIKRSNITKEEDDEGANEVEPKPEYVSPCFGDSGGPLFAEFKETLDGSKETVRNECVEARPNGSGDEDVKRLPACDRPKELARNWYVLVGLVSFGAKACGDEIPVAYTRVSGYLEWIAYVTGRHG